MKAGAWCWCLSFLPLRMGVLQALGIGICSLGTALQQCWRVPSNTSTSSSTWWIFLRSASSGSCSWISPLALYQMQYICYLQKHCSLHLEYHALSLGWCRTCWPRDTEGSLGHHSQLSSHLWPLRITSLLWQPSHLVRLNRKEVGTPPSSLPGCSTCYIL